MQNTRTDRRPGIAPVLVLSLALWVGIIFGINAALTASMPHLNGRHYVTAATIVVVAASIRATR